MRRPLGGRWVAAAVVGLALMGAGLAQASPTVRYLVIGASEVSPAAIAQRTAALTAAVGPGENVGLVLSTADCGERKPVFAWASAVLDSAAEAQAALLQLKRRVPDAFVKRCVVRSGSLLEMGLPAVDASIAAVPAGAVNWIDADRISTTQTLSATARLVYVRHHVVARDDPLEGRRTRVLLVGLGAAPRTLLDDCTGAGGAVLARGWLALACDSEQAADHVLHRVHVFTAAGEPVTQIERCRKPRLAGAAILQCQSESVDAQGRLKLLPRNTPLVRP